MAFICKLRSKRVKMTLLNIAILASVLIQMSTAGVQYCDEFTDKCHRCQTDKTCFCREFNLYVSLPCQFFGRQQFIQLLNRDGTPICPTEYFSTQQLRRNREIDEPDLHNHFCRCSEDISLIGTNENSCLRSKMLLPSSSTAPQFSNVSQKYQSSECPFPLAWFAGDGCSNLQNVSILVWALFVLNVTLAVVCATNLLKKIRVHQKRTFSKENVLPKVEKPLRVLDDTQAKTCEAQLGDSEGIYFEPQSVDINYGYMTMAARAADGYVLPNQKITSTEHQPNVRAENIYLEIH